MTVEEANVRSEASQEEEEEANSDLVSIEDEDSENPDLEISPTVEDERQDDSHIYLPRGGINSSKAYQTDANASARLQMGQKIANEQRPSCVTP